MHAIDGEERRKRALVVVGDERREHDGRTAVQFRRANRREFILGAEMRPSGRGFPRKNRMSSVAETTPPATSSSAAAAAADAR